MAIKREQVGKTLTYNKHKIVVRFLGPDLLCYVDGHELNGFYPTAESARIAGRKYADLIDSQR